jgi:hypothetical protein
MSVYRPKSALLQGDYRGHAQHIALDGEFAGWICYEHPDGQLVSLAETPLSKKMKELVIARASAMTIKAGHDERAQRIADENTNLRHTLELTQIALDHLIRTHGGGDALFGVCDRIRDVLEKKHG